MSGTSDSIIRIAAVIEESIVDGPGLRFTVFTQGCPHHCRGCHNPQTHSPNGGHFIHIDEIVLKYKENPLLSGITFSGGEPFMQPLALANLAQKIKALGGNVITYTGFCLEILLSKCPNGPESLLLAQTDILIDGPYIEELRTLELPFRGSSNQRILYRHDIEKIADSINLRDA